MNHPTRLLIFIFLLSQGYCGAQDMDQQLSEFAEKLAHPITERAKKKVTVIDFTDLQGGPSGELGKYIAEQLTVELVMGKRDFSVLDRANLKSILAEHKLTSQGLVDPENAKKLGQFAGVDALILGTIIPKKQTISLTAKIITTDTAEVVGAARTEFKLDETVSDLMSHVITNEANSAMSSDTEATKPEKQKPKIVSTFDDMRVEVQSLKVVNASEFLMTLCITNHNQKHPVLLTMDANMGTLGSPLKSSVIDSNGLEFVSEEPAVSGLTVGSFERYFGFQGRATQIAGGHSAIATIRFFSQYRRPAQPGMCTVQLAILRLASNLYGNVTAASTCNVVGRIQAE